MSNKPKTTWASPKPKIPEPHFFFIVTTPALETAAPKPATTQLVVCAFKLTPPKIV